MSFKYRKVMKALGNQGAEVVREGKAHTIVKNAAGLQSAIPRHSEVDRLTARAIVRQLAFDWAEFEGDAG